MEEKEAFFKDLFRFDEEEEDEPLDSCFCHVASILRHSKARVTSHVSPLLPSTKDIFLRSVQASTPLARTISTPLPGLKTPLTAELEVVYETPPLTTPTLKKAPGALQRLTAGPGPTGSRQRANGGSGMPKASKKRKRGQSLDMMPGSQQIFKGLGFYFIPDNDIAPARRMRIRKAMEWGAAWIREFKDGISHVIVDSDLNYKDVLSFLKIQSLPAHIILVNEVYPAECISFRYMINPRQTHYQVDGYHEVLAAERIVSAAPSSITSLALKSAKGELVRAPQTPSRTEGSDQCPATQESCEAQIATIVNKEPIQAHTAEAVTGGSNSGPKDALDEAIEEARLVKDLPLVDEEDEVTQSMSSIDSDHEGSDTESKRTKLKSKGSLDKSWQKNFSCMQKHDGVNKLTSLNTRTIEVLRQMADYYDRTKDHWRLIAYRKAIAALRKQEHKIMTKEEAFAIPFIGERLALKIEEIVWTNRLRRLDNTHAEPNDEVLQKFLNIYGVGYSQASKWISQGHRTFDDLRNHANLTNNQKVGLDHYDDFLARIPRAEMELHGKSVREAIHQVDKDIQVTIGGSYRRGAADSGDVDFIISKPDAPIHCLRTLMLETVIPGLFARGYLKVGLATTSKEDGTKWHGASCLPGSTVWRRIDFLLVPWEELGAAMIYFTGNDIFNRSIRLLASKKGMRLNQRGLWRDVIRGPNRQRVTQGTLVEGRSEKKIFQILGVPWRPPEHRIC